MGRVRVSDASAGWFVAWGDIYCVHCGLGSPVPEAVDYIASVP